MKSQPHSEPAREAPNQVPEEAPQRTPQESPEQDPEEVWQPPNDPGIYGPHFGRHDRALQSLSKVRDIQVANVYDLHGYKIGSVGQVYVDDATNEVKFVTVRTGFHGLRETFIPLSQASPVSDGVQVPFQRNYVKNAPNIEPYGSLSRQEEQRIFDYYSMDYILSGDTFDTTNDAAAWTDVVASVSEDINGFIERNASVAAKDTAEYTVPGLEVEDGHRVGEILQLRLHALNDLQLALKHAHWNVVGRNFIGVHEMLDPQIDEVRAAVDVLAERMATLGVSPLGTPGSIVKDRTWDDYDLVRADTIEHIAALDQVYDGVVADHRNAIEEVGKLDPVTEDLLIGQTGDLEQFQWFLRSFLTNAEGELSTAGEHTEKGAAKKGKSKAS